MQSKLKQKKLNINQKSLKYFKTQKITRMKDQVDISRFNLFFNARNGLSIEQTKVAVNEQSRTPVGTIGQRSKTVYRAPLVSEQRAAMIF